MSEQTFSNDSRPKMSAGALGPTLFEWKSRSRWVVAGVFWILCLTLSAAGHRLYKETVSLDRAVSVGLYQERGTSLVWIGHGAVAASFERVAGRPLGDGESKLYVLPISRFWLGAALFFTGLGGALAWSGRWIANAGLQSLAGLLAGHLLWLGAIELGLDVAGRRFGLAASFEVVGDCLVGTHSTGMLIRLSVVFLVPLLIGLCMHESNRCAIFKWLRDRLPIARTPAASGRVENYAARTAIQFFMTVWFCYVSVLWLSDPVAGRFGAISLFVGLIAIVVATPYMIWRTTRQTAAARALRYSVSGAVVTWTAIEIAASMQLFREPWLSTSAASGLLFLISSTVLLALAARCLVEGGRSRRTPPGSAVAIAFLVLTLTGCADSSRSPSPLTLQEIDRRLREYDARAEAPQGAAVDALLRALVSGDPEMRAQAAVAFGKARSIDSVVRQRLEAIARSDESPLSQLAALDALDRLDLLTSELKSLRKRLRDRSGSTDKGPG